jgi:3-hydroxyacyl-[acyl-carrier-protein] dehydratase
VAAIDPTTVLPHRPPFLFLDTIEELTADSCRGRYRYKPEEFYFAGHFPGEPVVPGVIQIETMAQAMVAMGLEAARALRLDVKNIFFTLATDCMFHQVLRPGDEVIVRAAKLFMRLNTLQSKTTLHRADDGTLVAEATLRGTGKGT